MLGYIWYTTVGYGIVRAWRAALPGGGVRRSVCGLSWRCMVVWMGGMEEWENGRAEEWMGGRMEGRMGGRVGGCSAVILGCRGASGKGAFFMKGPEKPVGSGRKEVGWASGVRPGGRPFFMKGPGKPVGSGPKGVSWASGVRPGKRPFFMKGPGKPVGSGRKGGKRGRLEGWMGGRMERRKAGEWVERGCSKGPWFLSARALFRRWV